MLRWNRLVLFLALSGFVAAPSLQADDGWKWNPFSSEKSSSKTAAARSSAAASDSYWSNLSMPKLQTPNFLKFSGTNKAKPKRNSNSMLNKMSRTSKSMWSKTVDFLDPYPNDPPKSSSSSSSSDVEKASWFNWGAKKEKTYTDANDWLRDGKIPN